LAHQDQLSEWISTVSTNLPHLSGPQARVLALWSYGIVMTRSCGRTTVAAFLALLLGRKAATLAQQLQEWLLPADKKAGAKRGIKRRTFAVTSCFAPLLAWILRLAQPSTLALAVDASTLQDLFVLLVVSVVYRGCAIPVAWTVVPAGQRGSWRACWLRMLRQLRTAVPPDVTVLVLADRGLYARWLFRRIVRLGWHPFLRVNAHTTFRPAGRARFYRLTELVPMVGARWQGEGTAFKTPSARLACTLTACWSADYAEAWCVLTDLPPRACEVTWYGLRSWCEQGFKVLKRGAWFWQHTRMSDPERVARLGMALAVATLWMVSVGSELDEVLCDQALPELYSLLHQSARTPRQRQVRLVRLGLLWLLVRLLHGKCVPLPRRLTFEPWPHTLPPASVPLLLEDRNHSVS
jgi:DDE family transposase